uniref:Uncharacterized protein n=1 Tax=Ascaris lumbricoides TaxID=6252 RepID=A0A0M3HHE2_ASCLU
MLNCRITRKPVPQSVCNYLARQIAPFEATALAIASSALSVVSRAPGCMDTAKCSGCTSTTEGLLDISILQRAFGIVWMQ